MTLIDFHTHHGSLCGETVLRQGVHTWGIHPWNACEEQDAPLPQGEWLALGECGLDRLCHTPWDVQMRVFRRQVLMSEELRLPLILHCVKAHAEMLSVQKELRAAMPWICHGFRGKPQQMRQLLQHGWYLSFGTLFNEESARTCPPERLLTETDDKDVPVGLVYERIAQARGTTVDALAAQMRENYGKLFGNAVIQAL